MIEEHNRCDIDSKYKWDLTYLFSSDNAWYKEFPLILAEADKICEFFNYTFDNSQKLYSYLKYHDEMQTKINKLWLYAISKYDQDRTVDKYREMYKKVASIKEKFENNSEIVEKLIYNIGYDKIENYVTDNEKLKEYNQYFKRFFNKNNHQLSNENMKLLDSLKDGFIYKDIANELRNITLDFGSIIDESGNNIKLTNNNYNIFKNSNDRIIRQDTFEKLYSEYEKYRNVFSTLYNAHVSTNIGLSNLKKYNSPLEDELHNENINKAVYDNLIDVVNDNLSIAHKYYDLKKKCLNLDELHMYDIYAPFPIELEKEYSYETGIDIIFNALKPLGKEYLNMLKNYISSNHIDVYNNIGKLDVNYCRYILGYDPLILLNYQNSINSVETLIHELGHAMHHCFSFQKQPYIDKGCTTFISEIPSTVNEMLLWNYLLNYSNSLEEKIYALNYMLDDFHQALIRQTMFAEFEKKVYEKKMNKEELTSQLLCDTYYDLNKKYFGENVVIDDLIRYEWMRVPHFYYNFYCYTYATGLSIANKISNDILNNKNVDNYINFLCLGKSDTPINELKTLNIDIMNKDYLETTFKIFNNSIDKLENLYNEYEKTKVKS